MAPIMRESYSPEERALIAGYLLRHRRGAEQASRSVSRPPPGSTSGWGEGLATYYRHALRYVDFLLYWVGYQPDGVEYFSWPVRHGPR